MKKAKLILKKLLIIFIVIYLFLTSGTSSFARPFDDACGDFLGEYATEFIETYGPDSKYGGPGMNEGVAESQVHWQGGDFGKGTFWSCCTSGVWYMYQQALGVDIYEFGYSALSSTNLSMGSSPYWEEVSFSDLQAGDIVVKDGHTEMVVNDDGTLGNFGSGSRPNMKLNSASSVSRFSKAFRATSLLDVTPQGSLAAQQVETEDIDYSIYDDNGFIYRGAGEISGYEQSKTLGNFLVSMKSEILDYLVGIMTLSFRIVVVGWTALVDRVIIDGIVNSIAGVTNKKDEDWAKNEVEDEIDAQVKIDEEKEAENVVVYQDIGTEAQPANFIGTGVQTIAAQGSKVQSKTTSVKNSVTIENMVYNKVPILDANFFNLEEAGGSEIDQDEVIYLIRSNVALWYYIFRIISILYMLATLIYLGIKMALSTIAEKKAVYKEMMLGWLVGFILVFATGIIMYLIFQANEIFISWIIPNTEDGTELSLYETVRTNAYSLKFTTGFVGMIMYIVLVYYTIRFLFVYFKRLLTLILLAVIAPFTAVAYSIESVNKKGKGGAIYTNWLKDFSYTVALQSIHALIYTIFVQTALQLTQMSFAGVLLGFFFLNFLIKAEPIARRILGIGNDGNSAKNTIKSLTEIKAMGSAVIGEKSKLRKIGRAHANFLGNTIAKPAGRVAGGAASKVNETIANQRRKFDEARGVDTSSPEYRRKEREREAQKKERNDKISKGMSEAVQGVKLSGKVVKRFANAALALPMIISGEAMGVEMLGNAYISGKEINRAVDDYLLKLRRKTLGGRHTATSGSHRSAPGIFGGASGAVPGTTGESGTGTPGGSGAGTPGGSGAGTPRGSGSGTPRRSGAGTPGGSGPINLKDIPNIDAENIEIDGKIIPGYTGPKKVKLKDLNKEQQAELAKALGIRDISLLDGNYTAEDILGMTNGNAQKIEEFALLAQNARQVETQLQNQYKEYMSEIEKLISQAEARGDHKFAEKLRQEATTRIGTIETEFSEKLTDQDIFKAMQNYQSKVPQFNQSQEFSQANIEGLTKEINSVLKSKGKNIAYTKEFAQEVQKQLVEYQRKAMEEQGRRAAGPVAGQDMSAKAQGDSVSESTKTTFDPTLNMGGSGTTNTPGAQSQSSSATSSTRGPSLKDRVRQQNMPDLNDPNSSRNAPQQNGGNSGESAMARLAQAMINASTAPGSKVTENSRANPKATQVAQSVSQLKQIQKEMNEILGTDDELSIREILERLEAL